MDNFSPDRGGREQRPRREPHADAPRREPRHAAPATPRSTPKPQRAADGFDFSKPYEPAAASPGPVAEKLPALRGRANRPTAALLGGLPVKEKK
jgi:ATP-dependent RNA helicase RhlE